MRVSSQSLIRNKVPVRNRTKPIESFVVCAVDISKFSRGDTVVVSAQLQTSNPNPKPMLISPGVYACRSFDKSGYKNKDSFRKIIPTNGTNVAKRQHHMPFSMSETYVVGDDRTIVLLLQGNIRDAGAADDVIQVAEASVSVAKIG